MARLTQQEFAKRFGEVLDRLEIVQVELARAMGKDPVTISRWRDPKRKSQPPIGRDRRKLEALIDLPAGYLDGTAEANLDEIAEKRARSLESKGSVSAEESPLHTIFVQAMAALGRVADDEGRLKLRDALAVLSAIYKAAIGVPLFFIDLPGMPSEATKLNAEPTSAESDAGTEAEHLARHREQAQKDVVQASPRRGRAAPRSAPG